ncbi:MAG: hypothetical protein JSS63_05245 [Bacteroidetes bacterium]|nr:hypothetical protein [Bacteroidota bacterium]
MKFLLITLLFLTCAIANAQSVFIQSKKYFAPYKDEYRQDTAVFELPDIIGGVSNDMQHRLAPYLSPDSLLGENIDSVIANYISCGCGTVGATYRVLYNNDNVLSISVAVETMGAYPDAYYVDINLNLAAGKKIKPSDFLVKSKMKDLAAGLDKIMQKRIKDKIKSGEIGEEDALQFFEGAKFTEDALNHFAFTEKGVMFYYNFSIPHALKALSPDEDFLVTWKDLKEYVREGSLADKIINK